MNVSISGNGVVPLRGRKMRLAVSTLALAAACAAAKARPPPPVVAGAPGETTAVTPAVVARPVAPAIRPRPASASRLAWPVEPVDLRSGFGPRRDPLGGTGGHFHEGLDLGALEGQYVRAAARGVVMHAGPQAGYGLTVMVQHGPDLLTVYAHLSAADVFPGDVVAAGDPLGLVGATGRATGPHLHFEVRASGRPVDPLALLPPPR